MWIVVFLLNVYLVSGFCLHGTNHSGTCVCEDGYTGRHCQIEPYNSCARDTEEQELNNKAVMNGTSYPVCDGTNDNCYYRPGLPASNKCLVGFGPCAEHFTANHSASCENGCTPEGFQEHCCVEHAKCEDHVCPYIRGQDTNKERATYNAGGSGWVITQTDDGACRLSDNITQESDGLQHIIELDWYFHTVTLYETIPEVLEHCQTFVEFVNYGYVCHQNNANCTIIIPQEYSSMTRDDAIQLMEAYGEIPEKICNYSIWEPVVNKSACPVHTGNYTWVTWGIRTYEHASADEVLLHMKTHSASEVSKVDPPQYFNSLQSDGAECCSYTSVCEDKNSQCALPLKGVCDGECDISEDGNSQSECCEPKKWRCDHSGYDCGPGFKANTERCDEACSDSFGATAVVGYSHISITSGSNECAGTLQGIMDTAQCFDTCKNGYSNFYMIGSECYCADGITDQCVASVGSNCNNWCDNIQRKSNWSGISDGSGNVTLCEGTSESGCNAIDGWFYYAEFLGYYKEVTGGCVNDFSRTEIVSTGNCLLACVNTGIYSTEVAQVVSGSCYCYERGATIANCNHFSNFQYGTLIREDTEGTYGYQSCIKGSIWSPYTGDCGSGANNTCCEQTIRYPTYRIDFGVTRTESLCCDIDTDVILSLCSDQSCPDRKTRSTGFYATDHTAECCEDIPDNHYCDTYTCPAEYLKLVTAVDPYCNGQCEVSDCCVHENNFCSSQPCISGDMETGLEKCDGICEYADCCSQGMPCDTTHVCSGDNAIDYNYLCMDLADGGCASAEYSGSDKCCKPENCASSNKYDEFGGVGGVYYVNSLSSYISETKPGCISYENKFSGYGKGYLTGVDIETDIPVANYFTTTGPCEIVDNCVTSSSYPNYFASATPCDITALVGGIISVEAYNRGGMYLQIGGTGYYDTTGPEGVNIESGTEIYWRVSSRYSSTGFKICLPPRNVVIDEFELKCCRYYEKCTLDICDTNQVVKTRSGSRGYLQDNIFCMDNLGARETTCDSTHQGICCEIETCQTASGRFNCGAGYIVTPNTDALNRRISDAIDFSNSCCVQTPPFYTQEIVDLVISTDQFIYTLTEFGTITKFDLNGVSQHVDQIDGIRSMSYSGNAMYMMTTGYGGGQLYIDGVRNNLDSCSNCRTFGGAPVLKINTNPYYIAANGDKYAWIEKYGVYYYDGTSFSTITPTDSSVFYGDSWNTRFELGHTSRMDFSDEWLALSVGNVMSTYNINSGTWTHNTKCRSLGLYEELMSNVAFSPDGEYLLAACSSSHVLLFEFVSDKWENTTSWSEYSPNVAISAKQGTFYYVAIDTRGSVKVYKYETGSQAHHKTIEDYVGGIKSMTFANNKLHISLTSRQTDGSYMYIVGM